MSKGVINSITLDKTVILGSGSAEVTVDYTASGSDVFTLDDFVNPPSYLKNILTSGDFQQEKITATDDSAYDHCGKSVAISGDYAIVSAVGNNTAKGYDTSVAYIFKRNGSSWVQQEKLLPDVTENYSNLSCVAISGDYAIIGAHYDDNDKGTDSGCACIFKKEVTTGVETWHTHTFKLYSSGGEYDYFGWSVAISGNYAIVGAYGDDDNGTDSGCAYIFKKDDGAETWSQQAKLTADDGKEYDQFGKSVAISGNYAIVGAAYGKIDGYTYAGAAYIFKKDDGAETWSQQEKLTATKDNGESDAAQGDEFGCSVAIDGDYAIVGAQYHDGDSSTNAGAAYIFYKDQGNVDNWGIQKKLTPTKDNRDDRDVVQGDYFGTSVAISGDYAIVGAYGDNYDYDTRDTGSAYIFKKEVVDSAETWTIQKKLTANDAASSDKFGWSVAIDGDYAIVGAPTNNTGSAYIFNGQGITLTPPVNTVSLKKLEIKTNNWTGVTESDYFLINTYSGQGSGIMTALYNTLLNSIKDDYVVGSGVGYTSGNAAGSKNGYTTGYAAGSGNGYTTGYTAGSDAGSPAFLKDIGTITVHPGWNIFSPAKSGTINDTDNIIIDHTLQYFNGTSYKTRIYYNELEEGKGYMVKCKGSGSFTINFD